MKRYESKNTWVKFKVGEKYLATKGVAEIPVICLELHSPTSYYKYGLFDTGTEILKLRVYSDKDDDGLKIEVATSTAKADYLEEDEEALLWAIYADLLC